jgi:hypothetical protein
MKPLLVTMQCSVKRGLNKLLNKLTPPQAILYRQYWMHLPYELTLATTPLLPVWREADSVTR